MKQTDYGSFAESNLYINKVREDLNNNGFIDYEEFIAAAVNKNIFCSAD